ncbi:YggS family pyridoxal phosphate-dependent enzyme [Thermodesulfobacterium hydrogeniphilum]|uniref:YggS family pyridoxal phosphate-dependent enzyme n=1 Tax=Thermodesulfobacterium hydrogeniphilum TaxID=161156 RepID=UPI00068FAF49|nr:YggS family pyridoxal phosphate-dependent enzyme [Thermodesulfobacterium hydrogeniphilum]
MEDIKKFIKENFYRIKENIEKACQKAGIDSGKIKILGASKKQSVEKIKIVYELGIKLFGENYVQEAEKKIKELKDFSIEWHFIGRLQTNKVKKALKLFSLIETLDRIELAKTIQKYAKKLDLVVPVFIEVNIGEELTKAGILPDKLEEFIQEVKNFDRIKIKGLMCLPPYKENPEEARPYFIKMRNLFEKLKPYMNEDFTELSMGTTNDYVVAIEEGATIIRIGEALFGKRE